MNSRRFSARAILKGLMAAVILVCLSAAGGLPVARAEAPAVEREAEIRAAVTTFILQKTANLASDVKIKRLSIGGGTQTPAGPVEYEVLAPQQWEGWGRGNLAVIARQGGRVVRNVQVLVEVEALTDMVVTVRQIDHGTLISAADLALRKQDIALVQGRFLNRIQDAVGKKARSTLKANAPLRPDQLEKVPLVKPGQIVTIIVENERMRITVTGKAKSAGAEGDTITVQNLSSLKEFPARVVDANTVVVVF